MENNAWFVVKDSGGEKLTYVYFYEEPGRRSTAEVLARDDGAADRGQRREAAGVVAQT
jgi:hypothetical protein